MQPNQQPTDWQQPAESPAQAPYQVPAAPSVVAPQPAQQPPVAQPLPQVQADQSAPVVQPVIPVDPVPQAPAIQQLPVEMSEAQPGLQEVPEEFSAQPSDDEGGFPEFTDEDAILLRWQGTEYMHDARSIKWYIIFGLVTIAAVAVAIMVLKSITFAILIPVMVVALLVYVRRAPEVMNYILSRKGLHVNDKLFSFDQFKAFGVTSFNGAHSVTLIPRKRFQIGQTIYFPEEIGEPLVDMLAERLPMKEIEPDVIDKLLAKLHL